MDIGSEGRRQFSAASEVRFRKRVSEKGGVVVGGYRGTQDKVRLRGAAGHEWDVRPHSLMTARTWCPHCAGRGRGHKGEAKFRKAVEALGGRVVGAYVNYGTRIAVRCACGHEWGLSPEQHFLAGRWCPECRTRKDATLAA
jgi:hypothetical protein